jgi:hypothetical protein
MKKRTVKSLAFYCALAIGSAIIIAPVDAKEKKKDGEMKDFSSEDLKKDYEALKTLYKELKTKAEEFQKKYGMLPPELMPIMMGSRQQGGGMMGGPGGGPSGEGGGMMKKSSQEDKDVFQE